ncbi:MAG TPA: sirohydrochlorin cobaltochelatase, partial [Ruminococcus flavefaciens]|nr:sirohydrochlorin cobaltochelatase [Ruminococcus flavefaciens]
MKKLTAMVFALTFAAAAFASCGENETSSVSESSSEAATTVEETTAEETTEEETTEEETTEAEEEEEADDEEDYDTGDASLDDVRNGDDIGENELLVVSFGTSFNDSRRLTIGAIEGALDAAFPDYSVRRGFTSNIIIDHVNSR